jgi:hypothetical protein
MRNDHAILVGLETIVSYWCPSDGVISTHTLFFATNFVVVLLQAMDNSEYIPPLHRRSAVLNLGAVRMFADQRQAIIMLDNSSFVTLEHDTVDQPYCELPVPLFTCDRSE